MSGASKCKVLIVDDEQGIRDYVSSILRRKGFVTETAADGNEALSKAAGFKPDIIVLDIIMPGLDGFQTHRRLKEDPETKDIPVIFCTSLPIFDIIKSVKSPGDSYLSKPFRAEELCRKIDKILNITRQ